MTERDWLVPPGTSAPLSRCRDILDAVAQERGLSVPMLCGPTPSAKLVSARREVIRRATEAGLSAARIADTLCRDPSTISHHQRVLGLR